MKYVLIFSIMLMLCTAYLFRPILSPIYYKIIYSLRTDAMKYTKAQFDRPLLYRFFSPVTKNGKKYPLVVVLHSAAERGSDNFGQIDGVASILISKKIQKKYPSFVLMPQCPDGTQWVNTGFTKTPFSHYQQSSIPESMEMKMIHAVIRDMILKYPIDTSRIYVGGFSMGGSGTWEMISRYPDLFAAAFVMAGVSDTSTAAQIKNIPVWAFSGELDNIAPASLNREMCEALNRAGGNCKFTMYHGVGHYCVHEAMKEPGFVDWLFSQRMRLDITLKVLK